MSLFSKLFGGGKDAPAPEPIEYEGFRIIPEPAAEDGQFRLAARIERDIDGETKTHHLIRADLIRDRKECEEAAVFKAKQMIDQMGSRIFG
ncbi:HlyU family transcriptional regulator [Thalassococcus lentus]|uniref:HlyU family transcriptional regulator n=1 Tax=Thalassococcus lentus TaxID=1210524 RepID=A0ABT4XW59_9RHOB|nr:HlyU family transcriptional regulator [Thalassococcus lentus]MDA7426080.1 HlyU family transcriptional regulator [Thalassococcus lentus]